MISTDTSKGTIKIYSSWPLTGTMEGTGGDAVVPPRWPSKTLAMPQAVSPSSTRRSMMASAANNGGPDAAKETENVNKAIADADCMVYDGQHTTPDGRKISIPISIRCSRPGWRRSRTPTPMRDLTKAVEGVTEEGEPDLYYPTGKRNYMRVCPPDDIQGSAEAVGPTRREWAA